MRTEIVAQPLFDVDDDTGFAPEAAPANPLLLLHRHLRGHYTLTLLLAGLLSVPLAVLGYVAVPPKYTSTGLINIAPTRPYILYENEFTERLSSFDSFVQSQANLLQSQRVLSAAVQNEDLRKAGWRPLPAGLIELSRALEVRVPRGGQDIFVRVSSDDPRLAKAATNAVLDEYAKIAVDVEASQLQSTISTITDLREEARQERDEARSRAYQLAEREGTDDLARRREAKHQQLEWLEQLQMELGLQLPPYETNESPEASTTPDSAATTEEDPPLEVLAAADSQLAAMLTSRQQIELEIQALLKRFGPAHRQVKALQDELSVLESMIETRALLVRPESAHPGGVTTVVEAELRRRKEYVDEQVEIAKVEARRIGKLQLDIDRLREEADRSDERFKEADARLESLRVQSRDGQQGRISIAQRADTPLTPSTDRRLPLAALGAISGAGAGVGLVLLLGILRPKYRFIGDIESQQRHIHIMGAIPEIDAQDAAARELLAVGVHQIRTAIDARLLGPVQKGLVHLVTSASAGEGKSTVALRLARSFAVSGKNTLVIDADLIGRRVTSNFGMNGHPGFADACLGLADPAAVARSSGEENLSILPAGSADVITPERISTSGVAALLERLRPVYDAILIDTGPILGSIEAQAAVPNSDEVLLVVSRGTGVRLVKLAIDRLHRLGPPRLGVIFNRATMHDLERSTSFSMTSQRVPESPFDYGPLDGHRGNHPTSSAG